MFVRERDISKELWHGPRSGTNGILSSFGIKNAFPIDKITNYLPNLIKNSNVILFDKLINREITKKIEECCEEVRNNKHYKGTNIMSTIRLIKSESEIEIMRESCKIAALSMINAMKLSKKYKKEQEIATIMEYECKMRGAERLSYPPVVAGGINALTLHYITNDMLINKGDLLLVDAGCEYHGYSSDITRTWPIDGRFTEPQLLIYNLVLKANIECINMCKINNNVTLRTIHQKAVEILSNGLIELGIIKNKEEYINYYPHSIGHYLGMDVHDTNDLPTNIPLQPGMIITIEPGLYLPDLPSIPPPFRNIGIRIEDDVLITNNLPDVLTHLVPKDPFIIEQLINN